MKIFRLNAFIGALVAALVAFSAMPALGAAAKVEGDVIAGKPAAPWPANQRVDLNTATKAELEKLPGIGAATADAVIKHRPYKSLEEVRDVPGVGDTKFAQMLGKVKLGKSAAAGTAKHSKEKAATPPIARNQAAKPAPKAAPRPADAASSSPAKKNRDVSPPTARNSGKIDLNTANRETLMTLPGVGGATADAIIQARPFRTVADLNNVRGIGDARFNELKPLVIVRTVRARPEAAGSPAPPARETGKSSDTPAPNRDRERPLVQPSPSQSESSATPPPIIRPNQRSARSAGPNQASPAVRPANGARININTATQEELEALLGIGPVKARAIIDGRPYHSLEEVMRVSGIKEGVFGKIQDQITVK